MRHDDPFSPDDSAASWVETGPPQVGDTVKVELVGVVLGVSEVHGADVLRVAVGPFEHSRQEILEVRADRVAVVKRAES